MRKMTTVSTSLFFVSASVIQVRLLYAYGNANENRSFFHYANQLVPSLIETDESYNLVVLCFVLQSLPDLMVLHLPLYRSSSSYSSHVAVVSRFSDVRSYGSGTLAEFHKPFET